MKLIDTHAHLDLPVFDEDRAAILAHCQKLGITRIVVPGIQTGSWPRLREVCAAHPGLYPAYGLHPVYLAQHGADDVTSLASTILQHRPIAVGEIGLDFYLPELDRQRQQALFDAQLAVAAEARLPVLLHVRKAHDAVLHALRKTPVAGGICHAFNGSLQQAEQYLALGFKLGFGGMLTYERARRLHRLAQQLPLEAMVLETDAPDMTVASHHGERNSPEYLPECLQALATLRDEDPAVVAAQTTANAETVLDFSGVAA
ncbi:MAG TPA: TatD family deoxyribonuclease [Gammaproteobacteria bacterium]|nr:TatD family deoxyribonuclease [Gammaproteobacteria bacterium]